MMESYSANGLEFRGVDGVREAANIRTYPPWQNVYSLRERARESILHKGVSLNPRMPETPPP